ncbi:hypothetical protein R1flu_006428 [Riccia fluitans]|uniref:Expansin n=1 Tax=Riccia fluitans TaxID=41844 RepID=A0ABD1YX13_9MARC
MTTATSSVQGLPATATFYGGRNAVGTNSGACGYANVLAMGYGKMNTALSGPLFDGGRACGACFEIRCVWAPYGNIRCFPGKIIVTGTNFCPRGSKGGWCDPPRQHFDLSQPAFLQIAPYRAGIVHVDYRRVQCRRAGGVKFRIYGHIYFMQVLVYNVAGWGDVVAVAIKGSAYGGWVRMDRSWGQLWSTGFMLERQALSFAVTTSDGQTIVNYNLVGSHWRYGQTFEGKQFR